MPGLEHLPEVNLPDYWIDRHEVTNREFKRFVDDGGYRRAELWREPFLKDGRPTDVRRGYGAFPRRDRAAGPGDMGDGRVRPPGRTTIRSAGVSWYEAAAYARWAGKSLPTIYHWSRAADHRLSGDVLPASNFSGKSLLPVGASGGITRGGTTDMAGNVKEWCLNAAGAQRYILGGAWNEPRLHVQRRGRTSPFARDTTLWIPLHQGGSAGGSVGIADSNYRVSFTRPAERPNRSASRFSRPGGVCTPSTTGTSTRRWKQSTIRRPSGAWKR